MRLNLSHNSQHQLSNQSLLSQSLSDLRSSSANQQQVPMIFNQSNNSNLFYRNSTPVRKKSCHSENFNNNCDEDLLEEQNYIATSPNSNVNAVDRLSRIASPDSMATMTPTSSQVSFVNKQLKNVNKTTIFFSDFFFANCRNFQNKLTEKLTQFSINKHAKILENARN